MMNDAESFFNSEKHTKMLMRRKNYVLQIACSPLRCMVFLVVLRNIHLSRSKKLEAEFAQLNTEHVEILVRDIISISALISYLLQNELVKTRLQNDEVEGELVRYKLLCVSFPHRRQAT